ncbi:MAG TPA: endonuclease [Porphyromonadaceae bacterium]|nr:endonuclease [Porphyromonadaceae bacterium]
MKKRTEVLRPGSKEEWLKLRQAGIGSSEVASIVGLNPFETKLQLWRRKMGIDVEREESFAMKAGHFLEDAVAKFWEDATGSEVIKRSAGDWISRDVERPYLQVSPDRTYWLSDKRGRNSAKGILECKTTQREIDEEDLPKHWFCQLQYQLGVAGLERGSLAWLVQGRKFGYKEIDFVPSFFEWMCEAVGRFYEENIVGKKEPEMSSAEDVMLKYPRSEEGKSVEANGEVFELYRKLKEVNGMIRSMDEDRKSLEEGIKMRLKDAECLTYCGDVLVRWKSDRGTMRFDEKSFREENPEMFSKYMKERKGVRRFVVR